MKQRTFTRRIFQRRLHLLLVAALLFPALGQLAAAQSGIADMPYRLVPGMTSSYGVAISSLTASGSLIAWEDHRGGRPDVFIYDFNEGREFRASSAPEHRREPALSGSIIVWLEGEDPHELIVRGVDLAEGLEFDVTEDPARIRNLAMSSRMVVWQQRSSSQWSIRIFDRETSTIEIFGVEAANSGRPDASGPNVVWQEHDGHTWNIRRYDAESGWPADVTESPHNDVYPRISRDHITFLRLPAEGGPPQLIVTDLSGENERIIESSHYIQRPAIHGDIVVWEDWRSGLPDIYAYDIARESSFAVARSQQANAPAVSDRVVAWISGNDPSSQRVQALEIQERIPTDPQDPPAIPSPDSLYITATQQFVSGGFKSFWQANGGPQVFGYPLTTEFSEDHPVTGEPITVQYFERVKLEYHPQEPEDDRIRLALLGYELSPAEERGGIDPFESDEFSRYFPETGQAISFGFKQYWEENGGLGIFGFPITGEFSENGRNVQYFERARFEVDPETGQVQLGLLGREALQARGWLPPPPVDTTQIFE
jgi:beta propeller repeat protein